jgi:uncharacterized protein (TIGR03437 family)
VLATAGALEPGTYTGLAVVTTTSLSAAHSQTVSVTLTVVRADPPQLASRPAGFSVAVPRGTARRSLLLEVLNRGGGTLPFAASLEFLSGQDWLSLSAGLDVTPSRLQLTLTPGALAAGIYRARVLLSSGAQRVTVPVTLAVSAGEQAMELSRTGLQFTAVPGGPAPPPQSFHVLSGGTAALRWRATSTVDSGQTAWLSTATLTGSAAPDRPSAVQVSVNPASLGPGRYFGEVLISPVEAGTPPRSLLAVLDVLSADSTPPPLVLPAALVFTARLGGTNPALQAVQVHNVGRSAFRYNFDLEGDPRVFSVTAAPDRMVASGAFGHIDIGVSTTGLTAGIYSAALNIETSIDDVVHTVSLGLIVEPPPRLSSLAVVPLLYAGGFTGVSGIPMAVDARIYDTNGTPLTAGAAHVVLDGTTTGAHRLTHVGDGLWSGSIVTPALRNTSVGMTITALNDSGRTGAFEIPATVRQSATPMLNEGGILSAASFRAYEALAPGGIAAIFGTQMADGPSAAPALPLPAILGSTSVRIAGAGTLPLFYAGETQINAVLPFGLATEASHTLVVRRGNAMTYASFLVASAQPGVLALNQQGTGQAIVVHGDNPLLLANRLNPVTIGQSIVIYCEGLGPVTPEIMAGAEVPTDPLHRASMPVVVAIDGREAVVIFAGLTPGFTALYQVNAIVPDGVRAGDAVELVVRTGERASAPVTIAVRP